jgi:ribonuclease G
MGKELVISADRHETRAAILEDDQLVEIYLQRANEYPLAGSIHKGRVTRVLPGMQSAFVDIGLERDAFLYVSDFFEENDEFDRIPTPAPEKVRSGAAEEALPAFSAERRPAPTSEPSSRESRTRRSRRRRKGRGFPESKYAGEATWTRSERSSPEPAVFPVLPGESLAKYSRLSQPTETEPESPEGDVQEERIGAGAVPSQQVEGPAAGQESHASQAAEPLEPTSDPAALAQASAEMDAHADREEERLAEEAVAPQPPMPAPEETIAESELEAETQAPDEAQTASAAANEAAETTEAAATLEAEVREAPARYPHRLSRRLHRKLRSEGRADAVPESAQDVPSAAEAGEKASFREKPSPSITELLREGQEILVQIAKEPLGQKGARITSHIALPGRYVVYMPTVDHLGVSRKIASEEERARLRRILQTHRVGIPGGFIIRTAGAGHTEQEIAADMMYLYNLWLDIRQKAEKRPAPCLIHHDLDLVQRVLRDQLTEEFKAIWTDNEEVYESVLRFVERVQPSMISRVKMYTRSLPIFDAFNITAELEKALRPKVWLKSGGYIVINQTEALVAIDINTGKFVGKSGRLEDTIVKTNLEAIKEIVRQIRLRDLGGIIVIDFIDMEERKNRQKVFQALEEEMRQDRAPYKILQFNDFGLVAITRKRVKQSLERALCSPCPTCDGAGYVKSVQTVIGEILQEARKIAGAVEGANVVLRVHPDVAKALKSTANDYLEELEETLRRPVLVTSDPALHPEKFDLA